MRIKRFVLKNFPVFWKFYKLLQILRIIGQKLHLTGAREVHSPENELMTLVLNKSYPLGAKGTRVHLPKDKIIFEFIKLRGSWETAESRFLAMHLKRLCSRENQERVALIDIGANTGLVTLQVMNLAKTQNDCILFEPVSSHAAAIRRNLSGSNFGFSVKEFALGDRDGSAEIFQQTSNWGNSSLVEGVVPTSEKTSQYVKIRDSKNFFASEMNSYDWLVLKCDTQGYDALILSRIPIQVWNKIQSAVIEVWALPFIDPSHVRELEQKLSNVSDVSWDSEFRGRADFENVSSFWLSKTSESRNLFLRR